MPLPAVAPFIAPALQFVGGAAQAIFGGGQAKRAQNQLESMVKNYKPNASIMDYYSKALQRYNVDPRSSALYRNQMQNAARGMTTGLSALKDRRSAIAGVGNLVQGYNDASLRANAAAEGQQAQALGQLGQATQMKAQEDFKPFEMKYNLLSMKAGGGNQIMNAGLSNMFGGLGSATNTYAAQQAYGTKKTNP